MKLPEFITFTGADESTDPAAMYELQKLYPIEWGVLFSPKRQGEGRYPSLDFIRKLVTSYRMNFAAHLCGGHSRDVIASNKFEHETLLHLCFERVQINTADPNVSPGHIRVWADRLRVEPILQCRKEFPDIEMVNWLFDASGGRGIEPASWPRPVGNFVGYAGGLKPDNVAAAVSKIGTMAEDYWIDMESGVRDAQDRFSIDLCRQVCEAVYGKRGAA
ncbi:hypothetical protein G5S34_17605 [Herbaspirillum frisingense]|uniref:hypothetical protein n=1 Tax=Herbaspirillum frisingense TaxID=92645 RepID=UPI0016027590|nr:hypothetical protein [Herbaspirillum frisingense]QNB08389.1 hypothetical protein G5S34_17605 [Herbaspirillum frisingense]